MLTKPISTAPPKMVPLDTSSALLPLVLFSRSPTLLLSLLHTPMPPSTRYRNATAIIQTKNNATDSTNETFNVLHGSMRRICMLARTGPRARADTWTAAFRSRPVVVDVSGAGRQPVCAVPPAVSDRTGRATRWRRPRVPAFIARGRRSLGVVRRCLGGARRGGARDEPVQPGLGAGRRHGPPAAARVASASLTAGAAVPARVGHCARSRGSASRHRTRAPAAVGLPGRPSHSRSGCRPVRGIPARSVKSPTAPYCASGRRGGRRSLTRRIRYPNRRRSTVSFFGVARDG